MKRFRSLTFSDFVLENYGIDNEELDDSPIEISDEEKAYMNYIKARNYTIDMLSKLGTYNSEQSQIIVDRTVRKFNLDDAQQRALQIDIFDWENRDNDDMNAGIEEGHEYRHSPGNMKNFIDKIFKSGRSNVRNYQEFKVPIQK